MRVGIVGTGYAARLRAEALRADGRAELVVVAGHNLHRTKQFGEEFGAEALSDWSALLHSGSLDLVFICTINRDHAAITRAALGLGLHVVVEYPLAFDLADAQDLVKLAQQRKQLLHIEHIELLSGVHLLLQQQIPALGEIFAVNYMTLTANRPAPDRWTYMPDLFGFPLVGAVSRIHRLVSLFGRVQRVTCQLRTEGIHLPTRYSSCYCTAQLTFGTGLVATITYAKGESIWRSQRTLDVYGQMGALFIDGEQAVLLGSDGAHPLDVGSRRGLFEQDTRMVLNHLLYDHPLYGDTDEILHSLAVALAAQRSAVQQKTVLL